jgi:hypothetical protein
MSLALLLTALAMIMFTSLMMGASLVSSRRSPPTTSSMPAKKRSARPWSTSRMMVSEASSAWP